TMTDNEEGKFVADAIQEQKLRNHYQNKDFAILYRTNAQSRAFEESLRRMGVPYVIFGGISFYQRKEIKDVVAYLRVTVNPNEEGEVGDKSLAAYLQQITLLTDQDEKDPNADVVKVMTVHSAKGLEFQCVFVAGLEEMLFPNGMSVNTREELEEERRLFYVAI